MRCPISPAHVMCEVAPGLHQCPDCGAGPLEFWALSDVDVDVETYGARCATWRQDLGCYVLSLVSWTTDPSGRRKSGERVFSTLLGYASTEAELHASALPVRGPAGEAVPLRAGMFSSALGEKTGQRAARGGRSAAGPSPARSAESSPRHRRRVER